jgi:hypothetical protein
VIAKEAAPATPTRARAKVGSEVAADIPTCTVCLSVEQAVFDFRALTRLGLPATPTRGET